MNEEPTVINLTKTPLKMSSCGVCKALMLRENEQDHWDWHVRTETA